MDKDLARRIRKAKRAQAKRSLSLSKGKKKCNIGKSCGATCIARHEICAVEMEEGISQDLGRVSKKVGNSRNTSQPSKDPLAVSFSNHFKENSFAIPGRSYTGEDLANMINQVASGLTGEARENIDKLRKFVVEDRQVLFITTHNTDKPFKRGLPPWALSDNYLKMLDKALDFQEWSKYLYIGPVGSTFLSSGRNGLKEAKSKRRERKRLKAKELKLLETIKTRRKKGLDTSREEYSLDLNRSIRSRDAKSFTRNLRPFSNVISFAEGANGLTYRAGRLILMADNRTIGMVPFSKSQKVDAKDLQSRISQVIERRAKATETTDIKKLDSDTYHFSGKRQEWNNGSILMTYIHEVGHQVHWRGGMPDPPSNSTSLNRSIAPGITRYSTEAPIETFAEAFVAYTLNPKALRNYDFPLYSWVKETLELALSNAGSNEGVFN